MRQIWWCVNGVLVFQQKADEKVVCVKHSKLTFLIFFFLKSTKKVGTISIWKPFKVEKFSTKKQVS